MRQLVDRAVHPGEGRGGDVRDEVDQRRRPSVVLNSIPLRAAPGREHRGHRHHLHGRRHLGRAIPGNLPSVITQAQTRQVGLNSSNFANFAQM